MKDWLSSPDYNSFFMIRGWVENEGLEDNSDRNSIPKPELALKHYMNFWSEETGKKNI